VTEVIDGPDLHAYFDGTKPVPSAEEITSMRANGKQVPIPPRPEAEVKTELKTEPEMRTDADAPPG
jgi:hypothetical protein